MLEIDANEGKFYQFTEFLLVLIFSANIIGESNNKMYL